MLPYDERRTDMVKVTIVGAGWIGGIHADRLAGIEGARLVAVHDANAEAGAALAEKHGCVATASLEEAIDQADAVIICVSTAAHRVVALACVRARTPFLVEKPVAQTLDQAIEVREAVADGRIVAMTGLNRRFAPRYQDLRSRIAAGDLGRVESVRAAGKVASPPSADFLKTSGGLFGEFGIHFLDLACWLVDDEPTEIYATGSTLTDESYRAVGQVDTAALVLRFRTGALFQLDIGWRSAYGHDERIEVFGERGVLTAGESVETLSLADASSGGANVQLPDWFERFEDTYALELEAFLDYVRNSTEPSPSIHDGVVAQLLAEAAGRSLIVDAPLKVDTRTLTIEQK